MVGLLLVSACSGTGGPAASATSPPGSSTRSTSGSTGGASGSATTTPGSGSTSSPTPSSSSASSSIPARADILFSPQGNNLEAYATSPPFTAQRVNRAHKAIPPDTDTADGWDINGQICVFHDASAGGRLRLISGEDTDQPTVPAGFGVFDLDGEPGSFSIRRVGKLTPTYQPTPNGPDNFGCGVLSDGRVVTTDIGNNADGPANGQLTIWFPPFDREDVAYCKVDTQLATGQSIVVDPDDRVYVVSPRPAAEADATSSGVFRYDGPFPTGPDAAGGCGRTDGLGSPLADALRKERVLTGGEHGLLAPSGIAHRRSDGHWFVSSVITGVIAELDADWSFVRTVLEPPAGEQIGERPYSTGTPLGVAVGSDGTVYYADIGIVRDPVTGFGPGDRTGTVRRITFRPDGTPNPPDTLATDLAFPDGLGLYPMGA